MTSEQFADLASAAIQADCRANPSAATFLGNHDYDHLLDDPSPAATEAKLDDARTLLATLDSMNDSGLDDGDRADAAILRNNTARTEFELAELDEASWNPMQHNPGHALYSLLSRDFAPLPERLASLAARLGSVPEYFATARERLSDLSAVHTETAISQLEGVIALVEQAIPAAAATIDRAPDLAAGSAAAARAVRQHQAWLRDRLAGATHSARVGEQLFGRRLALTLATPWEPKALLDQAYRDLERVEAELADVVSAATGRSADHASIAAEFGRLGQDAPSSETILSYCESALAETTAFVADRDLITLYHDPVEIIEMPEIDRGIAVAYCRSVGALETAPLQTQFAVSPTPSDWTAQRVTSFYREYNHHMLHNLTVHEAMPGHVEQLSHSRRYAGRTKVRSVYGSGSFIEGWAVYAEELMVAQGYRSDISPAAASAVKMQQLKMQLRMILNTILDISFHTGGLDERGAMELMTVRGYQEDGEAAGKWRRVQLTSTQLCTYYVGYLEVRQLAQDLTSAHPEWSARQLHDTMLSLGSPPVGYLRPLLGLPAAN